MTKGHIGSYTGLQVGLHLGIGLPIWDPSPREGHIDTCSHPLDAKLNYESNEYSLWILLRGPILMKT